jgi:hypothetical protein
MSNKTLHAAEVEANADMRWKAMIAEVTGTGHPYASSVSAIVRKNEVELARTFAEFRRQARKHRIKIQAALRAEENHQ